MLPRTAPIVALLPARRESARQEKSAPIGSSPCFALAIYGLAKGSTDRERIDAVDRHALRGDARQAALALVGDRDVVVGIGDVLGRGGGITVIDLQHSPTHHFSFVAVGHRCTCFSELIADVRISTRIEEEANNSRITMQNGTM